MTAKQTIQNLFLQLQQANKRLQEAVAIEKETDIKRDAVIQRFEFTYELLWKMFKRIADSEKLECFSPKSAFQAAFKLGLIDDEKLFMEIIDARNSTTHVYSEYDAKKIYALVKKVVIKNFHQAEMKITEYFKTKDYVKKEKNHERKNH